MIVGQMSALDLSYSSTLGVRPPEQGGLIPDSAGELLLFRVLETKAT